LRKGPKYATILSKEVDCTYSHTVKLLDLFRDYGLVEFEKKGRIKIVKLTETGEEIAKGAESVLLKLSKLKEKSEK
jgi:DNA-binding MarR family transcriptional regulator